jgi:hypothetical protein
VASEHPWYRPDPRWRIHIETAVERVPADGISRDMDLLRAGGDQVVTGEP